MSDLLVFVDLPFVSAHRPNLAFGLLSASLREAGFSSSIVYAKLHFAHAIGLDLYRRISDQTPHEALLGDFIFGEALDGIACADHATQAYRVALATDLHLDTRVTDDVWDALPALRREATRFVRDVACQLRGTPIVGLTTTFEIAPALALARALKQASPDTQIVLGGGYCDGEMGEALHRHFPWVDFVCRGEGERLIVELLGAIVADRRDQHDRLARIEGLIWRDDARSIVNGSRTPIIRDLDSVPVPCFVDWCKQVAASPLPLRRDDLAVPFEASRGCWFGAKSHCTFCGLNGSTMTFRAKSPARILEELRRLAELGIRNVDVVDNIMDMKLFDTVLPALEAQPLGVAIFYEVKANLTRAQVRRLAAAGIGGVQPGIESLSTPVLKLMKKGVSAYQNVRLLKWLAEYGVSAGWNILYGFPHENPDDYRAMARLLPLLSHLQPPTGCLRVLLNRFSPLYDRGDALGVRSIRPAPGYDRIFGRHCPDVGKLAYYFAFDGEFSDPACRYLEPVSRALAAWRAACGVSSFTSLDTGTALSLFDRRDPDIHIHYDLHGDCRRIYLACDAGKPAAAIAEGTGLDEARVRTILDGFCERRWVVQIDGRYLSLAVDMTAFVPDTTPAEMRELVCTATYRERMRLLASE